MENLLKCKNVTGVTMLKNSKSYVELFSKLKSENEQYINTLKRVIKSFSFMAKEKVSYHVNYRLYGDFRFNVLTNINEIDAKEFCRNLRVSGATDINLLFVKSLDIGDCIVCFESDCKCKF